MRITAGIRFHVEQVGGTTYLLWTNHCFKGNDMEEDYEHPICQACGEEPCACWSCELCGKDAFECACRDAEGLKD